MWVGMEPVSAGSVFNLKFVYVFFPLSYSKARMTVGFRGNMKPMPVGYSFLRYVIREVNSYFLSFFQSENRSEIGILQNLECFRGPL